MLGNNCNFEIYIYILLLIISISALVEQGPEEVKWDWLGFACFLTESLGLESKTKKMGMRVGFGKK